MRDAELREILTTTRTIALVGFSANPDRPAQAVAAFLQARGYRVIPVNPGLAGQSALGETVYPDLAAIPQEIVIDMVDVFRAPEAVPGVVEQMLTHRPEARVLWLQLGVIHPEAAARAEAAGKLVVMDRCPKLEIARLGM
ncbi:CoA-binding protein [Rhodobacter capsulatus]|uniref:CoA-binding protein n=1 Tax=Rhodobacter capsulatus TaxID=1061 RepID=A0A4U1JP22_RHOCA|nr:CoA-binding protein [Rhodobacter capsulatus]TKD17710.1 CoA-binding protein [Rhodobacter capsulatus]